MVSRLSVCWRTLMPWILRIIMPGCCKRSGRGRHAEHARMGGGRPADFWHDFWSAWGGGGSRIRPRSRARCGGELRGRTAAIPAGRAAVLSGLVRRAVAAPADQAAVRRRERAKLARVLVAGADVRCSTNRPTTSTSRRWNGQDFLMDYKGALGLVAHDRVHGPTGRTHAVPRRLETCFPQGDVQPVCELQEELEENRSARPSGLNAEIERSRFRAPFRAKATRPARPDR